MTEPIQEEAAMEWIRLDALRKGAVFETRDGVRAVKSEYRYPGGGCECVLLASGEYAHFAPDAQAHNATQVRELVLP